MIDALVIVSVTPGIAAPCSSTALTRIVPVCSCASAPLGTDNDKTTTAARGRFLRGISKSPWSKHDQSPVVDESPPVCRLAGRAGGSRSITRERRTVLQVTFEKLLRA